MHQLIKYILCAVLLSAVSTLQADPFRDGVVAYQKKEFKQALDTWLPLAESGHVLAQTLVGSMYAYGEGIERDDNKAFKWLSLAANTGSAQAQYNLAILYEKGFGVSTDNIQARKWFKAAADQGRKDAATRLALLIDESEAIKTNNTNLATKDTPRRGIDHPTINDGISASQAPKQRIYMVLNGDNTTLLGPPNIEYGVAWVNQQPQNNYTIQLAASIEPRLIEAFKKHIKLSKQYADTLSTHNNKQWHTVIYGSYSTVKEAKQAMSEFPDSWKTWQPWIKKFSSVKHIKEK